MKFRQKCFFNIFINFNRLSNIKLEKTRVSYARKVRFKLTNWGIIILIILLTLNIVILLTGEPKSSHAAKTVQYKVIKVDGLPYETDKLQTYLNKYGAEGWDLIQFEKGYMHLIFKK